MTLIVTAIACGVAAVQTSITKRTFEEDMRRRARPALVPSSSVDAKAVKTRSGIQLLAKIPLSNHGGGPAYRFRLVTSYQIPSVTQAISSKETILFSLSEFKTAFGVKSSGRTAQLVVGNGQSYEVDLIDEVNGGFSNVPSSIINRTIYVLCLYENEAGKEMGTIFSLNFEFSLSELDHVKARIRDPSVLEEN